MTRSPSPPQAEKRQLPSRIWLGVLAVPVLLCQCVSRDGDDPRLPSGSLLAERVDFQREVKPILEIECLQCHNRKDAAQNAGLNLETREQALTTGRHAPVIIPGDPSRSWFVKVLEFDGNHPMNMPPAPDKIRGERLAMIKRWIREGADWPTDVQLSGPQDW